MNAVVLTSFLLVAQSSDNCPRLVFGKDPGEECEGPTDPNEMKKSPVEKWFTKEMFEDLFPKSNLGLGPHDCLPYSYKSLIVASRYFPEFGGETHNKDYKEWEHRRRDVAAFFAHTFQETGENDISLFNSVLTSDEATECFYRGGFFNWFERGPNSSFLLPAFPGFQVADGKRCISEGQYCKKDPVLDFWYPCNEITETHANSTYYRGCYFGRGALQMSWNYNYGLFQHFLQSKGINVDLVNNPNLVITKMDPPLAMLASLWFYMTPQPPKPSMHSIVVGDWRQSEKNRRAGFSGPIFGPTSLVINDECGGEDLEEPGGPGESRRIKAFKWFCKYFRVPSGPERSLSCKECWTTLMPSRICTHGNPTGATCGDPRRATVNPLRMESFDKTQHHGRNTRREMWTVVRQRRSTISLQSKAIRKGVPLRMQNGIWPLPYYDPKIYPNRFTRENERNRLRCVFSIYKNPDMFRLNEGNSPCLKHKPRIALTRSGFRN